MYILCIESSKQRGMGHFFRSLLFVDYFVKHNIDYRVLINNDSASVRIYDERHINYDIVDFEDESSWELDVISKYRPQVWINDKFITSEKMATVLSKSEVLFCLLDEAGEFDYLADIHFAGMIYPSKKNIKGKNVFCGEKYIIINKEVDEYRRKRDKLSKILVTLGGSDPFGATVEVVHELSKHDYDVDIVVGPNFKYMDELKKTNRKNYKIETEVPSLIKKMEGFDLAITGGGFTCVEAAASGLPSIIIANAPHEVFTGKFMEQKKCSIYAGEHKIWNRDVISNLEKIDIAEMSQTGLSSFDTKAFDRIMQTIREIRSINIK